VRFTVQGVVGERAASATQVVEFVVGDPPTVSLSAPTRINPSDRLQISSVASALPTCEALSLGEGSCSASFRWSVVRGSVDLESVVTGRDLLTSPMLALERHALQGGSYVFQLSVAHYVSGTTPGLATVTVQTNLPPLVCPRGVAR
jgi:hypothetical protein